MKDLINFGIFMLWKTMQQGKKEKRGRSDLNTDMGRFVGCQMMYVQHSIAYLKKQGEMHTVCQSIFVYIMHTQSLERGTK